MSAPRAEGEIIVKNDRFKQVAEDSKRSLESVGTSGQQSMSKIKTASTAATNGVNTFSQATQKAYTSTGQLYQSTTQASSAIGTFHANAAKSTTAVQNLSTSSGTAAINVQKLGTTAQTTGLQMTQLATAGVSVGTSAIVLQTSISNLDRAAQRVDKSIIGVKRAEDLLSATQLTLNMALKAADAAAAKSGKSSLEYGLAMDKVTLYTTKLKTAQEDLKVKQHDVEIQQDALNDTYTLFATSVATTVFNAGVQIVGILSAQAAAQGISTKELIANSVAKLKNTLVNAASIPVIGGTAAATGALTTATVGATVATRGLHAASLAFIASPIGIALIAIGAAFAAYESNVLGVRDALEDLTGAERGSFPTLSKFMGQAFGMTEDLTDSTVDLQTAQEDVSASAELAAGGISNVGAAAAGATAQLSGFTSEFGSVSNAMYEFSQQVKGLGVKELSQDILRMTQLAVEFKNKGLDPLSPAVRLAQEGMTDDIQKIVDRMELAFGKESAEGFAKNMRDFGVITQESFQGIIDKLENVNKQIDNSKKNYESLLEVLNPNNQRLTGVAALFAQAKWEFNRGNVEGAVFLEQQAQHIFRNVSTGAQGHIYTITEQIQRAMRSIQVTKLNGRGLGFTTTVGGISNYLSHVQLGGETSASAFARIGSSVEFGGIRSHGTAARDRNPRGRLDKIGERLRQQWQAFIQRWNVPINGKMVSAAGIAALAGIDLNLSNLTNNIPTFGNNDNRGSVGKEVAIVAGFNKSVQNLMVAFGNRIVDLNFLASYLPEEFDSFEDMVRFVFAGAGGRFANSRSIGQSNANVDNLIRKVVSEVNQAAPILGFDSSRSTQFLQSLVKHRDDLVKQLADAQGNPAKIYQQSGGQVTYSDIQHNIDVLNRAINTGVPNQAALELYKKSKLDFRNMVEFNTRVGRTGTMAPVTDSENFQAKYYSGLAAFAELKEQIKKELKAEQDNPVNDGLTDKEMLAGMVM